MRKFLRHTSLWILLLPISLRLLGTVSNQVVLYANHDRFPVSLNIVKLTQWKLEPVQLEDGVVMVDDIHCLMTSQTHLNLLADIFDFSAHIKSIGDIAIGWGDWLWTIAPFVWGFAIVSKLNRSIDGSIN